MTQSEIYRQMWNEGEWPAYAATLLRRADGYEMLSAAPGQTSREIVECQRKAFELREAANWRPQ